MRLEIIALLGWFTVGLIQWFKYPDWRTVILWLAIITIITGILT